MRECRDCGVPRMVSKFFVWREDGTILSIGRPRYLITFLESDRLEALFSAISDAIGIRIDRFLIAAQKEIGKAIYSHLPIRHVRHIPVTRFLRPEFLFRLGVKAVSGSVAVLGYGRISLDSYRAGESMVMRVKHPVLAPRIVGSSLGVYESLEKMPGSRADYDMENGELVIRMSHTEEEPEFESRLQVESVEPGPDILEYEKCPGCGTPKVAAETFRWDIEKGNIFNNKDERVVILTIQTLNAIFRELEIEIGEEMMELVFAKEKEITSRNIQGLNTEDPAAFWKQYLADMALRGMGYPREFEARGDTVFVDIRNSYNQHLYAAKLAAALEKIHGRVSVVDWEKQDSTGALYTIRTNT